MEVEDSFTINKAYALKYEKKKRTEELSKLRDKYGDVESESSSSDDEEEDENAEMLTADVEKEFLRTLSLIHSKDPRIYQKDTQFFPKDVDRKEKKKKEKEKKEKENKPMYLKDYERKQLVERGALAGVSDSEEEDVDSKKKESPTYLEEQEQLKTEFKQAAREEGEHEEDSLLTIRKKNKEEIEEEERDYILWLKGEKERMEAGEGDFSGLHGVWTAPDLDSGEAFLRDYILNRRFIDRDTFGSKVPTYDDIVGDSDDPEEREGEGEVGEGEGEEGEVEGEVGVSEDEASLDRQEEFERRYNFRFEEPGGDQIVSYPRTVSGSVRRDDDHRKEKRKSRDERRVREREQKEEELKRLKKLKRKEIKEKLERIKNITGNSNVGFSEADLDGDFDPASYDQAMAQAFDEDYYQMEEEEGEGEDGKPVFSDDNEVYDNWDEWEAEEEPHCEDPNFNMDADYDPATDTASTEKSKSLKHRHKLAHAVSTKKPSFDPEEKTFEEYFNEYYGLDYEDIVGDMPCRFKYNHVAANSFGLSVEEVLACEDKELNQWASLKKAVQIRTKEEEERDQRIFKKKARNFKKKYQILASLKEPQEEGGRKKSHKRKVADADLEPVPLSQNEEQTEFEDRVTEAEDDCEKGHSAVVSTSDVQPKVSKGKKRSMTAESDMPSSAAKRQKNQKKKKIGKSAAAKKMSSARLKSYGLC